MYRDYPATDPSQLKAQEQAYHLSKGLAQGYASTCNDAYSECEVSPPAMLSDVFRRLEKLSVIIGDTSSDLTGLSDRLFGAAPTAGGAGGPANKPHGAAAELLSVMDDMIERASYMRSRASLLNGRI